MNFDFLFYYYRKNCVTDKITDFKDSADNQSVISDL